MNNSETDVLSFFKEEREGEESMSDHTPRTEQTGEAEELSVAGKEEHVSREESFRALMEGEYKDLFTAYFQETFNRRFKEHKEIKEELKNTRAVMQAVKARYGTLSGEALLEAIRAETVLKNAPTEAEKASPMQSDEGLLAEEIARAEQRLLSHIRARGVRPPENGICVQGGSLQGMPHLTREERADMARRVANGERIVL